MARSIFTAIRNAGLTHDALVPGTERKLGSFTFEGDIGDGGADLRLTDLEFQIGTAGGIFLDNLKIGADGSSARASCTLSSGIVTCASIPAAIGSIWGERTVTLYGDISIPSGTLRASLQVSLTPPGSTSTPGAIAWTDGSSSFTWVPFDEEDLRSTFYSF
jgi:hypothetical protein